MTNNRPIFRDCILITNTNIKARLKMCGHHIRESVLDLTLRPLNAQTRILVLNHLRFVYP